MEHTINDAQLGKITIVRSNRAKRVIIRVMQSGDIKLIYPSVATLERAWDFLNRRREWILKAKEKIAQQRKVQRFEEYSPADIERLRILAKQELPKRVEEIAQYYGFRYGRVTIRASRSKWGCCTAKNNLSLSLFLMTLPQHLIDFIILHELCHTIHHNHSKEFHALLDKYLGGREKELNRELKRRYE